MPTPICDMAAAAPGTNPIHENNFISVSAFAHRRGIRLFSCGYEGWQNAQRWSVSPEYSMMKGDEI
jgi:hypothetical protein